MAEEIALAVADHLQSIIETEAEDDESSIYGKPVYFGATTGDEVPFEYIVVGAGREGITEDRQPAGLGRREGRTSSYSEFGVAVACIALRESGIDVREGMARAVAMAGAIEALIRVDKLAAVDPPIAMHWSVTRTELVPWEADGLSGGRRLLRISGRARI